MRWRTKYLWSFGVLIAFVTVSVFSARPSVVGRNAGGVSAPPALSASAESTPVVKLPQLHLDWCGHAPQSANITPSLRGSRVRVGSRELAGVAQPHYGPLHRRPPPSVS
jgi:hypothetical protein